MINNPRRVALLLASMVMHAPAAAQITVTDDFNRAVTLAAPAMRIISLGPHITENLFTAGAGEQLVGVVEHSDYPPEARRIATIGGGYAQINLEAVIALAPDLVVAWQTAGNRASLEKIARLGYPVYYSEPRDFEAIIDNIEELALLAGSAARINPSAATLRAELAAARARFDRESTREAVPTVFYQISSAPLITLNGEHIISRALELCGARNVFAKLPIIAPRLSVEAVVQANPDIIITGLAHGQRPDMSMWEKWTSVTAVKRAAFLFVDSDVMHRQTARMIMGIRGLCEQIDGARRGHQAAD